MSDKPILFSCPMVRAILEGHKTQTRRILKSQPGELDRVFQMGDGSWHVAASDGSHMSPVNVPYAIGDRLWVRETWVDGGDYYGGVLYRADFLADECVFKTPMWTPSIHMPRWASRLTLRVTDVRVQRVQDISEADAEAEGSEPILVPPDGGSEPHKEGFRDLWNLLNAKRGYGWDENPWVVALTFETHKCNIKDAPHGTA